MIKTIEKVIRVVVPANDNDDLSESLLEMIKMIEEDAKMARIGVKNRDARQQEIWVRILCKMLIAGDEESSVCEKEGL